MSSDSSEGLNTSQLSPSFSPSSSSNHLPHTPYSPKPQLVYHPPHDAVDNQLNQKLSLLQQPPYILHESSAPPYSQQPHTEPDQEESSAPIHDPIQQQIIELEQDPTSAPIDDEDNISLAAPIYDPTAVAAPYLTYHQEPTCDQVDTSRTHRNRTALIAFIVQLVAFLSMSIYAIVLWVSNVYYGGQTGLMPGVSKTMAPVFFYAILLMAFMDSAGFLYVSELAPEGYRALGALCYLSYFWTSQVITNIVYATVAGVSSAHYLPSKNLSENSFKTILKRVCTTSLGSICYGSLIITPVQIVRSVSNRLRTSTDDGDVYCVSCLDALIGCVRGFNTSINKYAFYDVATYGKPFLPAARDTWSSIESRRIDVLLRDYTLGYVLLVHAIFYAVLCFSIGVEFSEFGSLYFVAAGCMAIQIVFTAGAAADASAASALVALAKDPLVFAKTNADLFAELREAYPASSFGLVVIIPGVP
ncbi:putative choline transporter, neither null mutation nor overexpression affects choline transport [Podila verticillata]|nr:putative choline transporter, neither null mutation nor overexpression affects choline transport [Podila verticillata]